MSRLGFGLYIDCENDAFGEGQEKLYTARCRDEIVRLLREAARQVENGWGVDRRYLLDLNGNKVGTFRFERKV